MRTRLTMTIGLFTLTAVVGTAAAQVSCDPLNDCMTNAVCQADGSCQGVPKASGSPCNPSALAGDCATGGTCVTFGPSSFCKPSEPKRDGTTCTSPTVTALGMCLQSATCQSGFCEPQVKMCQQPADKCMSAFCNPSTGQCQTITNSCQEACSTGTCDPNTGNCIDTQPINEGQACGQGNVCTSNFQCHNGQCAASSGGTPVPSTTPTNTSPLPPTLTPTPTPVSPTPASAVCTGDCGGIHEVAVNDIIILVNIVLGNQPATACAQGMPPGVQVSITVIIQAVNNALNGCPTPPLSTPTNTSGPGTPTNTPLAPTPTNTTGGGGTLTPTPVTPTPTPSATSAATVGGFIAARAAGGAQSTIKAFLAIPDLLSGLLGHLPTMSAVSGSAAAPVSVPFTCSGGGGGTLACDQTISFPTLGAPTYTVTLNNCAVTDGFGSTRTLNGTVTAAGQQGDICFSGFPANPTLSIPDLTVTTTGSPGTRTATFTNFSATTSFECLSGSCQCTYDTLDMTVNGTLAVASQDTTGQTSTQATFSGTQLSLSVNDFGNQCVATNYSLIVDGNVTVATDGQSFTGVFSSYELDDDATSGDDMVTVTGDITSTCLGHDVSVDTNTPLDIPQGAVCPTAGELEFFTGDTGQDDLVDYTGGGAVAIDLNNDGTIDFNYVSCVNPQFLVCPAT
jgi:hypothetical protein